MIHALNFIADEHITWPDAFAITAVPLCVLGFFAFCLWVCIKNE